MRGINKMIVLGHAGGAPEIRFTTGGTKVANFTLATNKQWKDKQTGKQKENTQWHRCTAFGALANIVEQYVHQGSLVYVEGEMESNESTGQDGTRYHNTTIKVNNLQLLGKAGRPTQ